MNDLSLFIQRSADVWGVSHNQAIKILGNQTHNKSLRINTLLAAKTLLPKITKMGIGLSPINWADNCYEVTKGYDILKKSDLSAKGLVILQDSSSYVPVLVLNAKPKDTVLDICAAPGGKTSHIACLTYNNANIIANDSSKARYFKMKKYLNTLSVKANCTLYDGRNINRHLNNITIDKILLDAPCSGEANININDPKTYSNWSLAKVKRLSRLQTKLLITAYDLVKPGGSIVYSTCTIAPEENELVINNLIKKRSVIIEPINLKIKNTVKPVISYNNKLLDKSILNTIRIMPGYNNEAFFVALIKKPTKTVNTEFVYYG